MPGRIRKLDFREGAILHKNDPVAELDPADYILRRDEAKAALAHAGAQYALLAAGAREEDIARAREEERQMKAAAVAAAADLHRIKALHQGGSATTKQLDDATAASDRTGAALAAAGQTLSRLIHGNRVEEIRMAEALRDQAKARLSLAENALADCVIFSPVDGIVTARIREEGEYVTPGAPLLTVSKLDEVWLAVYVPAARIASLRPGQNARVRPEGSLDFLPGTVTFISPEAEFTPGTYRRRTSGRNWSTA